MDLSAFKVALKKRVKDEILKFPEQDEDSKFSVPPEGLKVLAIETKVFQNFAKQFETMVQKTQEPEPGAEPVA
jgi:hypothetical protein